MGHVVASGDTISFLLDSVQMNILTWPYVAKILCMRPNMSKQKIKMMKSGPSAMNIVMFGNCHISYLHETHA